MTSGAAAGRGRGSVLSERDKALRYLHRLAGGIGWKLRALFQNHRGRWPLV